MKTNNFLALLDSRKRIVIPPIQRDYAHGRETGKIPSIRKRFVEDLHKALTTPDAETMQLDFIYGYTNEQENAMSECIQIFTPLDGQQRLTTLFLLHWYIAVKEGLGKEVMEMLGNFSYATRNSSKLFCAKLVDFVPEDRGKPIASMIQDQPWFFPGWIHDPTINSMLVVLQEIESMFRNSPNVWAALTAEAPKVAFHLLPMEQLGLPDDIYIKMNSRGKELTDFEYFKSQFSEILGEEYAKEFNEKVDQGWSDLFWNQFKHRESRDLARLVDEGFMRFFSFITDILVVKQAVTRKSKSTISIAKEVYGGNAENIAFLFSNLDLLAAMEKRESGFFENLFYTGDSNYKPGKTRLFFQNNGVNLFRNCVETYSSETHSNPFTIREQLMLYACLLELKNRHLHFPRTIRRIRNLLIGTGDQIRNDNLASLYLDIENLVNERPLATDTKFSKAQREEEEEKELFLSHHPELADVLYELEDHDLFRGTISIFDFDASFGVLAGRFHQQFGRNQNLMEVNHAMLTIGDYSRGGYAGRWRFGTKNWPIWRQLLTPNEYLEGFDRTKTVLKAYLTRFVDSNNMSNAGMVAEYLKEFDGDPVKPKNWRYYFVRYDLFRAWYGNITEGNYYWHDYEQYPYDLIMLYKYQFNGRHWSPFLLELARRVSNSSLGNYGNELQVTVGEFILMVASWNIGFRLRSTTDDLRSAAFLEYLKEQDLLDEGGVLKVKQNEAREDIEDRIEMAAAFLKDLESFANDFSEISPPKAKENHD